MERRGIHRGIRGIERRLYWLKRCLFISLSSPDSRIRLGSRVAPFVPTELSELSNGRNEASDTGVFTSGRAHVPVCELYRRTRPTGRFDFAFILRIRRSRFPRSLHVSLPSSPASDISAKQITSSPIIDETPK